MIDNQWLRTNTVKWAEYSTYSNIVLGFEATSFVRQVGGVEPFKLRKIEAKMQGWVGFDCLGKRTWQKRE